jgi:hypothetical protein
MFHWLPRSRRTRRPVRVAHFHRPRLELLEDRRAPGDAVAGALLANLVTSSAPFSPAAEFGDTFSDETGAMSELTIANDIGPTSTAMGRPNIAWVQDLPSTSSSDHPQQNDLASSTKGNASVAEDNTHPCLALNTNPLLFSLASVNNLFADVLTQETPVVFGSFAAAASLEGWPGGQVIPEAAGAPSAAVESPASSPSSAGLANLRSPGIAGTHAAGLSSDGQLLASAGNQNLMSFPALQTGHPMRHGGSPVISLSQTANPLAAGHSSTPPTRELASNNGSSVSGEMPLPLHGMNAEETASGDAYTVNHDSTLGVPVDTGILTNYYDYYDEGTTLTVTKLSDPSHGTLYLSSDGSFDYTPDPGYFGDDSFTFRVDDGTDTPPTGTVQLSVVETPPLVFDHIFSVNHDHMLRELTPGVLSSATDVEGDAFTASLVSPPANGTVSLHPNGNFEYTPAYHFAGTDTFTYQANDGFLNSTVQTVSIDVLNNAPIAVDDIHSVTHDHTLVSGATVLNSDLDQEGDFLTASLGDGPSHGSVTMTPDGNFTYIPDAHFVGTDTFTYEASDGIAASEPATVSITVVNHAPLVYGQAFTGTHDRTLDSPHGLLSSAEDLDGDALTASVVTPASHGDLTLHPDNTFTYVPNAGFYGTDSFTFQANDSTSANNLSNVATVTLTIQEQRPVAIGAPYTGTRDEFAPNIATLRPVQAFDLDEDPLTFSLVSGPAHGSLQLSSTGYVSYDPGSFVGSDSFTFQVSDGVLSSSVGIVALNVLPTPQSAGLHQPPPPPPTNPLVGGEVVELTHDHTATGNVLVVISNPTGQPLVVSLVGNPAHGTMTVNADGSFTYVPNAGYYGLDTFSYQASNNGGTSNVALCVIAVVEQAPLANGVASAVVHDHTLSVSAAQGVLLASSDADGDTFTATLVSGPTSGSLTFNADGSYEYVPNALFIGTDSFTYKVNDGLLDSNVATVTITVFDHEPIALGDLTTVNQYDSVTVAAPGVMTNDGDADSDPITASLVTGPTHGSLTFNSDGSFTYTPDSGWYGSDIVVYKISDGIKNSLLAFVRAFTIRLGFEGTATIYYGLAGATGGQVVAAPDAYTKGAVTVANRNNTNGDFNADGSDKIDRDQTGVTANGALGRDEIDLMKLELSQPQFWVGIGPYPVTKGLVRVRVASGNVNLWTTPTKQNGTNVADLPPFDVSTAFAQGKITLWVEATAPSNALQDISLVYEYQAPGATTWLPLEKKPVRATAVWVNKNNAWMTRKAEVDSVNNPAPTPDDLPHLTKDSVKNLIRKRTSLDGSRYGFGTFTKPMKGFSDEQIGGRMLMEFKIQPIDVEKLGVTFHVSRQAQANAYDILNDGKGKLTPDPAFTRRFPWLNGKDNELPNDDYSDLDKQNIPKDGYIYSWDAPGTGLDAGNVAFSILRWTFKEWVRMRLDGKPFKNDVDHPDYDMTEKTARQEVEGSRVSDKVDWHMVEYLVADQSRYFDPDRNNPSNNAPQLKRSAGSNANGTATVTLRGSGTEGYTATYADDGTNGTWTLQGAVDGADVVADKATKTQPSGSGQGTSWELSIPNKVTLVITQGSERFKAGDEFRFTVFKSQSPAGKVDEIAMGPFTDVKGDFTDQP